MLKSVLISKNDYGVQYLPILSRRQPDRFSACMVSNPPGLDGPVIIYR